MKVVDLSSLMYDESGMYNYYCDYIRHQLEDDVSKFYPSFPEFLDKVLTVGVHSRTHDIFIIPEHGYMILDNTKFRINTLKSDVPGNGRRLMHLAISHFKEKRDKNNSLPEYADFYVCDENLENFDPLIRKFKFEKYDEVYSKHRTGVIEHYFRKKITDIKGY